MLSQALQVKKCQKQQNYTNHFMPLTKFKESAKIILCRCLYSVINTFCVFLTNEEDSC